MATESSQIPLMAKDSRPTSPDARPARMGQVDLSYIQTRDILTNATGFMDAYDHTLNPYAAFFSRDAKQQDSWGYWVKVKENAVELLQKQLRCRPDFLDGKRIYMSSVTDPYQPVERKLQLTRRLLELMADRHRPRLVVQTRSHDVARDTDLFRQIENNGGRVQVNITVTTDDDDIRRTFEPHCPSNPARLAGIQKVQEQDITTCITLTPLLLVTDPHAFANRLVDTGVKKFIIQPFHFNQGQFVAKTREGVFALMDEKLDCAPAVFKERYLEHYRRAFSVLDEVLTGQGMQLARARPGSSPPSSRARQLPTIRTTSSPARRLSLPPTC